MKVLFTRSSSILSKVIRHLTGEPVSHCAIAFDGCVVHSNLLGLHCDTEEYFRRHAEVLFSVEVPEDREAVLRCWRQYDHSTYDFGGLLYLGLRCLIPALPKKNLWQTTGMFLCTEWVTTVVDGTADSMITPYGLYLRMKGSKV